MAQQLVFFIRNLTFTGDSAAGCHKEHISCITYCDCPWEEGYCNTHTHNDDQFTNKEETVIDDIVGEDENDEDPDVFANQEDTRSMNYFVDPDEKSDHYVACYN